VSKMARFEKERIRKRKSRKNKKSRIDAGSEAWIGFQRMSSPVFLSEKPASDTKIWSGVGLSAF
jgi:hypothetical protein